MMSLPPGIPTSMPIPAPVRKKRVLLVDTSHNKRELRADTMRKLGIEVDCAADIPEARSWWRAAMYDLVLINVEQGRGHRDKFCDDVRSATPPQRLAFLVGQPEYLSDSPGADPEIPLDDQDSVAHQMKLASSGNSEASGQRWGILEASRRISAARSAIKLRAHAMRSVSPPPRDSERNESNTGAGATTLDQLLREELR